MTRVSKLFAALGLVAALGACNPIGTAVNVVTAPVDLAANVVDAAL